MEISITSGFVHEICIECGVVFWMPSTLNVQRREDKKSFYCPNGHSQAYVEAESDRLKRKLDEKEKELERLKTHNITLKFGFDNRERELVRLRKRVKTLKKVDVKKGVMK